MPNPLYSGKDKKACTPWDKPGKQKTGARIAHGFQFDQLARDLAQEWNEMAMGGVEITGWQA
jgi:hypothetical protein